jgi:mevalonate pyrophosphate decarboxylase
VDAGPNVHVICPETQANLVEQKLRQIEGVQNVLLARAGGPARLMINGD